MIVEPGSATSLTKPTRLAAVSSGTSYGYHWLRLEVTLDVLHIEQEIESNQFSVTDSLGANDFPDIFVTSGDPKCNSSASWGAYAPGESFGPAPLCIQVAGPTNGPLTLTWSPDPSGQGAVVVPLP